MVGKIIAITQQKGGVGKTTIAANLGVAIGLKNKRVAFVDTDPQGSLGQWFMARNDLDDKKIQVKDLGFRTASAWGARYEANNIAKDYDVVIIDTPPKMGIDGRPSIEVADLVIIPITPSQLDLWASEPTFDLVDSEKKASLLVLNRAASQTKLTGKILEDVKKTDRKIAKTVIGNRVDFADMMGRGRSVVEKRKTKPAALEITSLADEILKQF